MIAEVLLIKNGNRYLLEHLAYNASAGIEHFFIYDNLSDPPVVDFLRENARDFLNICTIMWYHSNNNLQLDCYADYLREHFDANPTVSPTNPEVVELMQKHGVNLETVQKYFDV